MFPEFPVSELIDIHDLLEKADRTLFEKIRDDENHSLYTLLAKRHCTTHQLRPSNIVLPLLKTEGFKNSFNNQVSFQILFSDLKFLVFI